MLGPQLECGEIGGQALRLVSTREEFLPLFIRWLGDPTVHRYLNLQFGLTMDMERKWFEGVSTDPDRVHWTIELAGEPIGVTGIEAIDWHARTATTGIAIGVPAQWGRGVAGAVLRRRSQYAFERLNLAALYTEVYAPNEASRRALESVGYVQYGLRPYARFQDGVYHDAWLGVLTREAWSARRGG
jgi:RimJ/RimL family protein N-acetyltransferase